MRRLAVIVAVLACAPSAQAASVRVLVVGRTHVLRSERSVPLRGVTARVGSRRCAVGARTPLAALLHAGPAVRLRDYGACGRRAADAASLFVTRVGADANRGRNGWVYKAAHRTASIGAGDPSAPLKAGAHVVWFWCMNGAGGCQRTLEVRPDRRTYAPGDTVRVRVIGYDDHGRGVAVPGADVAVGDRHAVSGPDGVASLAAPDRGPQRVRATAPGTVPSFSVKVQVT